MKEIWQIIAKKPQHFIQKVLGDIGNLKYVRPRRFFVAQVARGRFAEDISLHYFA